MYYKLYWNKVTQHLLKQLEKKQHLDFGSHEYYASCLQVMKFTQKPFWQIIFYLFMHFNLHPIIN